MPKNMRNGPQATANSSMHAVIGGGRGSALGVKSRQEKDRLEDHDQVQNLIQIVQIEARRASHDRHYQKSHINSGIETD